MDRKQHWEQVYTTKPSDSVSWFQEHADLSVRLIHNTGLSGSRAQLPAPSPLRTGRGSFDPYGSSLCKSIFRHPVSQLSFRQT